MKGLYSCLLFISVAFGPMAATADWTGDRDLGDLYVNSNETVYFGLSGGREDPANCDADVTNPSWYAVTKANNPSYNQLLALLVLAQATGRRVNVNVHSTLCENNNPRVLHVIVKSD